MVLKQFDTWFRARYRRTSSALTATAFITADLFGVMLSFGAGFFLVNLYDLSAINFKSFVTYWPYLPAFIAVFYVNHLYPGVTMAPAEELRRFFSASLLAHGAIVIAMYVEDHAFDAYSVAFAISWICSVVILLVCRSYLRHFLSQTRWWGIPAVIYGFGASGRLIADRLLDNRKLGYIPVAILDDDPEKEDTYRGIPVIHDCSVGPDLVRLYNIKMAIIAMPRVKRNRLSQIMQESASSFRYTVLIPDFFGMTNMWMSVRDFDGVLGLSSSQKLLMPWNRAVKRLLDISIVLLGGIVILPFLLILALLVKLSSPGPAIYGHTRLGRNGKPFKALKFRSMVQDADKKLLELLKNDPEAKAEWESTHKLRNDPRVTAIGRFLRKTSLDEFPQIWNILTGEMSLVGPRPIVHDEIEKYGPYFHRVFSVKPGLSGLWQVSGRSDTDYEERVAFDTYYIQSWSVWLDLWILYKTVGVVLFGKGAY